MTLLWRLCLSGNTDCAVVNGSAQIAAPDECLQGRLAKGTCNIAGTPVLLGRAVEFHM